MNKKATSLFILFLLCFAYLPNITAEQADYPEYAVIDGVTYFIGDEILSKRTDTAKTYFAGYTEDGKIQYTSDICQSEIHYEHNGELLDIDPTLRTRPDGTIYNDTNLFDLEATEQGIYIQMHDRPETGMYYNPTDVYYLENGTTRTIATFTPTTPSIVDGNRIAWEGAYGAGIEVYYEIIRTGIRLWIEVESEDVLGTVRNIPNASLNVACDFTPAEDMSRTKTEFGEDILSLEEESVFAILLPFVMLGEEDLRFGYHVYEQGQIIKRIPLDTFWDEREFPLMLDTTTTITATQNDIYSLYKGAYMFYMTVGYSGTEGTTYFNVGQCYTSKTSMFYVYHGYPAFDISLSGYLVSSATLKFTGYQNYAVTAFEMHALEFTESTLASNSTCFSAYGSTSFGYIPSSDYSTTADAMTISLNSSGIDYINTKIAGTCIFVLRSNRIGTQPTGEERIVFNSPEAVTSTKRPHLEITYSVSNATPTVDSCTFTNPSTSNQAIADNATEWNFRVLVSDSDGLTDITYVELRLANASDSTTPFDSITFRWTQSTDTFSEEADTQSAVSLTSTGSNSSSSGTQWTLDFKVKFSSNFTTKGTDYNGEVYVIDSASATDLDTFTSLYEVIAVSLSVNVTTDNTISWGTITTNTWTAVESETIENNGNVTEDIKIKFSTFSDGSNSWTLGSTQYDNGADKIVVMWSIDNSTWYVYTTYDSWVTIVEDKAVSSSVTLYVKMYAPTSTSSYQAHSSTLTVGCAQAS